MRLELLAWLNRGVGAIEVSDVDIGLTEGHLEALGVALDGNIVEGGSEV